MSSVFFVNPSLLWLLVGQESLEEKMAKAYDKFNIKLQRIQLLFAEPGKKSFECSGVCDVDLLGTHPGGGGGYLVMQGSKFVRHTTQGVCCHAN